MRIRAPAEGGERISGDAPPYALDSPPIYIYIYLYIPHKHKAPHTRSPAPSALQHLPPWGWWGRGCSPSPSSAQPRQARSLFPSPSPGAQLRGSPGYRAPHGRRALPGPSRCPCRVSSGPELFSWWDFPGRAAGRGGGWPGRVLAHSGVEVSAVRNSAERELALSSRPPSAQPFKNHFFDQTEEVLAFLSRLLGNHPAQGWGSPPCKIQIHQHLCLPNAFLIYFFSFPYFQRKSAPS